MTTYLGKSCSFGLLRVPFVNCRQFMYLVISLLVLRAGCGIWLYQFLIIAYLFTLLSTRKHWTINPSLAQAHHRHYRHIAFISFQLKIATPFRKLSKKAKNKTKKKKKKKKKKQTKNNNIAFNNFFVLFSFQISLQFFTWKNNGEMVWHEVTRCRRYNALKLSCVTTKYVFWSPIFPPQTTKLPPPNRSLSST